MRTTIACLTTTLLTLLPAAGVKAEEVPRDEYLKFIPLDYPRLVQQNASTDELNLYGDREDPAYRDVDPVDGIDDARHAVLTSLAVRFAPFLVQNTEDIPTNFDTYVENAPSFPLTIDTWNVSTEEPRLVETEQIDFAKLGRGSCSSSGDAGLTPRSSETFVGGLEDCKLRELLAEFSPWAPGNRRLTHPLVRARPDQFSVLFFNFPGEGAGTWKKAYRAEYEKTPVARRAGFPHAYVHPFLERVENEEGSSVGYELVLQYWFFYPTNDGGNNHEGDWEHLNVLIAPRSRVKQALSAETVQGILTGELPATDDADDPLVIRRTDYYFHHFVMTLDYTAPDVYAGRREWKADVARRPRARFQEQEVWKHIRRMAYVDDDETVVNTHPFAYIGADNKGLDQVLAVPGGKNRGSHGTFPFPGRYANIGPAGATEQISVSVDPRRYLARLRSGDRSMGPEFRRGSVLGLADRSRLRIVPDWERVVDLADGDAVVRRHWSWLLLPIRWGYPATASPFAGIVPHSDTGNAAPVGPSFSTGWNVSGPAPGFHSYEPHTLPSVFPLAFQDGFRNDLGFLNLTFPVILNLPPLDFATRIAAYPFKWVLGRNDPVFYPRDGVPFRFVGLSSGVSVQRFGEDFSSLALNPAQFDQFVLRFVGHLLESGFDSTTTVTRATNFKTDSVEPFYQMAFYIGDRFTSENTVRNARSSFGVRAEFNNVPDYRYSADIDFWEYAGSLRYGLTPWRLQPYVKGGYGWSWYRLENVSANGVPFEPAITDWIKPDGIWPNTWHLGIGIELVPWKRVGKLPRGAELAFRVEYARYWQNLGLDLSKVSLQRLQLLFPTLGDVPGADRVHRDDFVFGMTLSF